MPPENLSSQPQKKEGEYFVSVIIPCLNAQDTIGTCLDSVIANRFDKNRLEILVVDGMSTDKTPQIIADYSRRYPYIRRIENPFRTQQRALNTGIRQSRGDLIVRMDAHSAFSEDYISQCVRYLVQSGADNVGGRIVTRPRRETLIGKAIAAALSCRFGVGNSHFRVDKGDLDEKPRWVRTVPYACYRREVFDKVGFFNEQIDRSEDAEFHCRMEKAGCRTLFVPTIISFYSARSTLKELWRHAFDNGVWIFRPYKFTRELRPALRHLVPFAFVGAICLFGGLFSVGKFFPAVLILLLGCYGLGNIIFSARLAWQRKDWRLFFILPIVFAILHVGYGAGSWAGFLEIVCSKLRRVQS